MVELPKCQVCITNSRALFSNLKPEDLNLIDEQKTCSVYNKGSVLYKEGNRISGIYCIENGIVKAYKTGPDGKEQIVAFAKKGDITGYRSVLSNEPACTTAEVLIDTEICFIPGNVIIQLVKQNGDFALKLLQLVCKELNQANSFIKDIAQKTVRERLAEALLMLQDTFGNDEEGYLNISLTREELANIVGTATESVIRLLSEFRTKGIIEMDKKLIMLKDKASLKRLSKNFSN